MQGKIECFYDECYCVKIDQHFCGIDACECMENATVKLLSGNHSGEEAEFQKIGEKLCLVGVDSILEDIQGIEIEIEV